MPSMKLSAADITGIVGMIPTPSTPDADHWSCENSIAFDETEKMVSTIFKGGVRIFLTNGSLGEGATLTAREHKDFTDCVVQAHGGKGLVFAGVTTLNTRDTIARARSLIDVGADGLFLGRPMWMSLDQASIVRYYQDLSEALPGIPFIVYDNEFAFKAKIETKTYAELSRNPSIIGTKHIGGPSIVDDIHVVEGRMRVLPLDNQWAALAESHTEEMRACWSGNVADGCEPLIALQAAVKARDWSRASHISKRMIWAQSPMFPQGKIEIFVDYNIPLAHARIDGSGLVKSGPPRPPYMLAPEDYMEGGRETGRRWAALREEFSV